MQQGGHQGPIQHHIAQSGRHLQAQQGGQGLGPGNEAIAVSPQQSAQGAQRQHHNIGAQAVGIVDGHQRRHGQPIAHGGLSQRAPQLKPLGEVHVRPPTVMALGKGIASQHRVIGTDPATQGNLRHQQHQPSKHSPAQTCTNCHRFGQTQTKAQQTHLPGQQGQQTQAAQQVEGHNEWKEFHGHGQSTKCALQQYPSQGEPSQASPQTLAGLLGAPTARHRQKQHQGTHQGGEVAVHHFDPGLAPGDSAAGQGRFCGTYGLLGSPRTDLAITTRPIGTAQARIGQPGEGPKNHQVKGQEQNPHREPMPFDQPRRVGCIRPPHPGHGAQGQQKSQAQHGHCGTEVEQRRGVHG